MLTDSHLYVINFSEQAGRPPCSLDPFFIMPDKCKCVDFQVLKLQELPDFIPQVNRNDFETDTIFVEKRIFDKFEKFDVFVLVFANIRVKFRVTCNCL